MLKPLFREGGSAREAVDRLGLVQISDLSVLEGIVARVLAGNPKQVAEFRSGKDKLKGFFVGQVMRESGGKANPVLLEQLLMARLTDV